MNLFSQPPLETVPELLARDLQARLLSPNRPYLLDVREPLEFRSGHIPGARLIPLGELKRRLHEVPQGVEVVCICASGHRSVPAVRSLATAGYTASSLKNGMIAWRMAGLPVIQGITG